MGISYHGSKNISVELGYQGYCPVARESLSWTSQLEASLGALRGSFEGLVQDRFMGDGGCYRKRRFNRFLLDPQGEQLSLLEGTSIHQSIEDNSLNGGRTRTFEPLLPEVLENPFLQSLIRFDFRQLTAPVDRPWVVGVHQVRIEARPGSEGRPTPEGIHLDSEAYTVQHLLARQNVEGGEFRAYDQRKKPVFSWLQTEPMDSIFFVGTTYHSASPIQVERGDFGYRDIFLIDFDPYP